MSNAQKVVQSGHALIEATKQFIENDLCHPNVIVFGIKNEKKLRELAEKVNMAGVHIAKFYEPDIGHQLTAFATSPVCGSVREIFSKYTLLK